MSRYRFYDNGSKVVAVSSYAGRPVRGVAKCDPRDDFNLEKGRELAKARCDVKIAQKRAERSNKCYNEAVQALHSAEKKVDQMQDYFDDSHEALLDAELYLEKIEKSL